ncbi:imidazole glycerol phosphate synthase subunit HisH [Aliarcobacter lanthieri]|uniref:imidazole glycerol phosphate synthase subunit HisH n=1 Tax=Aliarcobacter lanthieri TaxID=1355374 RepID=UPI003AAB9CB7
MIGIIDYGAGNIGSILNMFKKVGHKSFIIKSLEDFDKATKLVLPGVGSFDYGMNNLEKLGLIEKLHKEVNINKKPILGICLGMHLMTNSSEEGSKNGLGFINAITKKFLPLEKSQKIPHMGWNNINIMKNNNLTNNLFEQNKFYFVHSYYVECLDKNDILFETRYINNFVSAFAKDNIYGVQFHPEKSHKYGMQLFKNFGEI